MQAPLGIIISFSTNELCFLDALLTEASAISDDVVVSYGDKFFSGEPQDAGFVHTYAPKFPGVKWARYEVDSRLAPALRRGVVKRPTAYFHNLSRWAAVGRLDPSTRWVLVLDADEIPEGVRFGELYRSLPLRAGECYKVACYWYFKDVRYQATTHEDSPLLVEKRHLTEEAVFTDDERDGICRGLTCHRGVRLGAPALHHFSFIREGKEGLLRKLRNWGHADDMFGAVGPGGFVDFVHGDGNVNDIVHGYDYKVVDNVFHIQA